MLYLRFFSFCMPDTLPLRLLHGVSSELDRISREHGENGSRMGIALRLDDSVSRALEQQLVDMVLAKGMTCYIAAEPAD